MRVLTILGALLLWLNTGVGASATARLWAELQARRDSLPSAHQEFDVSQTFSAPLEGQSSRRQIVIDMSEGRWRERSVSETGSHARIFDGKDLLLMEEGGNAFVRAKHLKQDDVVPSPYRSNDQDWSKAVEVGRPPCGMAGRDDICVVLEVPLKPWTRFSTTDFTRMVKGSKRASINLETGLLVSLRTVQTIETERGGYQSAVTYALRHMSYGTPADATLFTLPSPGMREVKALTSKMEWRQR